MAAALHQLSLKCMWQGGCRVPVTKANELARTRIILEIHTAARLLCFRGQRKRVGTLEPGPPIAPDSPDRTNLIGPD